MTRRLGEGAQHGHYSPRPKETSHYTSSLGSLETVSDEPKGAFEPKRVEHETGGVLGPGGATSEELEPGKSFLPEPVCYGRKRSAPKKCSSNVRPTHACSGAYCAGKSSSSSWYTSATC